MEKDILTYEELLKEDPEQPINYSMVMRGSDDLYIYDKLCELLEIPIKNISTNDSGNTEVTIFGRAKYICLLHLAWQKFDIEDLKIKVSKLICKELLKMVKGNKESLKMLTSNFVKK